MPEIEGFEKRLNCQTITTHNPKSSRNNLHSKLPYREVFTPIPNNAHIFIKMEFLLDTFTAINFDAAINQLCNPL
jgi:hypothetical protein